MIDTIRETTVRKFVNLCRRLKITNYKKEVFMANSIEIMDNLEKRIKELESKVEK